MPANNGDMSPAFIRSGVCAHANSPLPSKLWTLQSLRSVSGGKLPPITVPFTQHTRHFPVFFHSLGSRQTIDSPHSGTHSLCFPHNKRDAIIYKQTPAAVLSTKPVIPPLHITLRSTETRRLPVPSAPKISQPIVRSVERGAGKVQRVTKGHDR